MEESGADLSKSQMETMMRHVGFQHGDSTKDLVDTHEFLARFAAVFKTDVMIAGKEVQQDQWAAIALDQIASHVMRVSASTRDTPTTWREANVDDKGALFRQVFQKWDKNGDGILSNKEFIDGLKHIPGIADLRVEGQQLNDEKYNRILKYIDVSNDGTVNYLEFVKALSVDDRMGTVSNALCEDITTTLYRNKQALLAACQFFDVDKTTKLTMEEFGDALEAVSHMLKHPESPFTYHQIHRLASSAVNEQGVVRYMDFVNSFEILDTFVSSGGKKNNGVARTVVNESSLQQM
jgi:Ca2+-binding EF-hand superfamily protein